MMTIDKTLEVCNCGQKPAFDGTNEPHWHRNSCPIYRPPPKKPVVTIESLAAELKELREFVGAMRPGSAIFTKGGAILCGGDGNWYTDHHGKFDSAIDAYRKMKAVEGE